MKTLKRPIERLAPTPNLENDRYIAHCNNVALLMSSFVKTTHSYTRGQIDMIIESYFNITNAETVEAK